MTERLLQFIWQFQYFNKNELTTAAGERLQIIKAGQLNYNQGPDFNDAQIRIGNTTWAGSTELHVRTTDWIRHNHQIDTNYNNVILHVVWEHDESIDQLPVLELRNRVPGLLLCRYEELMRANGFIPCENSIQRVQEITWVGWKDRLIAERLLRKTQLIEGYLLQNHYHWEETCWWLLARNFGMKVNADAFEAVARSIPLTILAKQKHQIHQIEALLFGQAGLLENNFTDDYPILLQREYRLHQKKYNLKPAGVPLFFLRMRPGNFPTIRLAQLAMLVHISAHLFSRIKEAARISDIREWFDINANDYWHYHYMFDEYSPFRVKKLGSSMIDNIVINTIVPLVFAYGLYHGEEQLKKKALQWLEQTSSEQNSIVEGFVRLGIPNGTAFDSQALIELKNQYCDSRKCLDCALGNFILKNAE